MTNPAPAELTPILEELRAITADAQSEFGGLSGAQLNWKPAPDKWSVAQCFDHLITANSAFFPDLEKILAGGRKNSLWQKASPFTGMIGRWMIRSLDPKSVRPLPAPKRSRPSQSDLDPAIVARFVAHQARVEELIGATEGIDLRRTVLTSPLMKLMTYTLLDGYQILTVHERRHLGQARRVAEAAGFPAS